MLATVLFAVVEDSIFPRRVTEKPDATLAVEEGRLIPRRSVTLQSQDRFSVYHEEKSRHRDMLQPKQMQHAWLTVKRVLCMLTGPDRCTAQFTFLAQSQTPMVALYLKSAAKLTKKTHYSSDYKNNDNNFFQLIKRENWSIFSQGFYLDSETGRMTHRPYSNNKPLEKNKTWRHSFTSNLTLFHFFRGITVQK